MNINSIFIGIGVYLLLNSCTASPNILRSRNYSSTFKTFVYKAKQRKLQGISYTEFFEGCVTGVDTTNKYIHNIVFQPDSTVKRSIRIMSKGVEYVNYTSYYNQEGYEIAQYEISQTRNWRDTTWSINFSYDARNRIVKRVDKTKFSKREVLITYFAKDSCRMQEMNYSYSNKNNSNQEAIEVHRSIPSDSTSMLEASYRRLCYFMNQPQNTEALILTKVLNGEEEAVRKRSEIQDFKIIYLK